MADMYATSPPESVHALDHGALAHPDISFFTARAAGPEATLLGCGALKQLSPRHGELKSMRTSASARGQGVASAILTRILEVARERGYERVSLETGAEDYFETARRLYRRFGFAPCPPFADYTDDPNSVYLSLALP
nr:GNAT family N-acetyltransferase [Galbitalea soli]